LVVDERKESVVLRSGGILSEAVAWSWTVALCRETFIRYSGRCDTLNRAIQFENVQGTDPDDSASTANHNPALVLPSIILSFNQVIRMSSIIVISLLYKWHGLAFRKVARASSAFYDAAQDCGRRRLRPELRGAPSTG
jgi:hypothetical protein